MSSSLTFGGEIFKDRAEAENYLRSEIGGARECFCAIERALHGFCEQGELKCLCGYLLSVWAILNNKVNIFLAEYKKFVEHLIKLFALSQEEVQGANCCNYCKESLREKMGEITIFAEVFENLLFLLINRTCFTYKYDVRPFVSILNSVKQVSPEEFQVIVDLCDTPDKPKCPIDLEQNCLELLNFVYFLKQVMIKFERCECLLFYGLSKSTYLSGFFKGECKRLFDEWTSGSVKNCLGKFESKEKFVEKSRGISISKDI